MKKKETDYVVRSNLCGEKCQKYTLTSFRIVKEEFTDKVNAPHLIKVRCIVCGKSHQRYLTKSGWNDLVDRISKKNQL